MPTDRSLRWLWTVFALFFLIPTIKHSSLADDARWYMSAYAVIAASMLVYAAYGDSVAGRVRKVSWLALYGTGLVATVVSLQTPVRISGLMLIVGATIADVWLARRQTPQPVP